LCHPSHPHPSFGPPTVPIRPYFLLSKKQIKSQAA
jgi:hypothetical protein